MNRLSRLADRRPFIFALAALLAWILLAATLAVAVLNLLQIPMTDSLPQRVGTLGATAILLLLASRLGWLRSVGIATFGTGSTWVLTLLLGSYLVLAYFWAFFGEIRFDIGALFDRPAVRAILVEQSIVGFVEETIFRGILLYALVRVWGKTKLGLLAAVFVQAGLFGCLHALQALAGSSPTTALANVLDCFIFGIWLGFLVLRVSSIWPTIFLHTISNATVLIKGLSSLWVNPAPLGYLRATLFKIPIVLIAIWIVIRSGWPYFASKIQLPEPDTGAERLGAFRAGRGVVRSDP
jgi:membrane protease YdiL (CAAX protease family)